MIEKQIEILEKLQKGEIHISDFYYDEAIGEEGHSFDSNANKRFHLLLALQYKRNPANQLIIKKLFEQEIIMHRKSPYQGITDSLNLNAYLLSEFSNPEYVWLFLRAKEANFDTHCGFDYQYLVSAGIENTYNYVNNSNDERKDSFFNYVGKTKETCHISLEELDNWKHRLKEWYPSILKLESLEDKMDMAIDLGEKDILQTTLNEWKDQQSNWSEDSLNLLTYYESTVGNLEGQIWAHEKLYDLISKDWDKASKLQMISKLYLKINRPKMAWEKLKLAIEQHLKNISDWKDYGIGRFIVENVFDVILTIDNPKDDSAIEAFDWARQTINNMNKENLHHNLLEKTAKAAELMGDTDVQNQFSELLSIARKRLKEILGN